MDHLIAHIRSSDADAGHQPNKGDALANLVYIDHLDTGISRRQGKNGFLYYDEHGNRITEKPTLNRINSLVIPPAYSDVIISADPNSHLQATGRDVKGRKQYRYHPDWAAERGNAKFSNLLSFAQSLPDIRQQVDNDLRLRKPGVEKALATVVWLLDNLFIRVGNATYAKENGSYGLTTLRNRHVKIDGSTVHFNFRGKSGKEWKLSHNDRRITRAIKTLHELPGHHLFQYLDEDGKRQPVRSQDVNDYIREASGCDFSSRQFRTWAATRMAAIKLASVGPASSKREQAQQVNSAIDDVASRLVNTRTVCRSSYIHPKVFEEFESGRLGDLLRIRPSRSAVLNRWMDPDEIRVMRWLESF